MGGLAHVYAMRGRMLRGRRPDVIVDRCSVHVKEGGGLTNPSRTDRGKRRTKHYTTVVRRGLPVVSINDIDLFDCSFRAAFAVVARSEAKVETVFADSSIPFLNSYR
jgi:hypothetical protein